MVSYIAAALLDERSEALMRCDSPGFEVAEEIAVVSEVSPVRSC